MAVYKEVALLAPGGYGSTVAPAPHVEGVQMSAVTRLQVWDTLDALSMEVLSGASSRLI